MSDRLGPCPAWCSGTHHPVPEERQDQFHQSASVILDVRAQHGTVSILEALLTQYPHAPAGTADVYAVVDLGVVGFRKVDPEDLEALASGLEAHAARLRQLGQQLTEALAEPC